MPRVILFLLLIYVLYWLGKRFLWSLQQKNKSDDANQSNTEEKMVQCARCETHIPESESMEINQQLVCKNQPCQK